MSEPKRDELGLRLQSFQQRLTAEKSPQEGRSRTRDRPGYLSFESTPERRPPTSFPRPSPRGQSMDLSDRLTPLPIRRVQSTEDHTLREIMKNSGKLTFKDGSFYTDVKPSDLKKVRDLGSGTCGHVVEMIHRESQRSMAVKQMRKSGVQEENRRIYMDLHVVLKCTECPNIVYCYGYFITDSDVWICMEVLDSCLDKLQRQRKAPVPEEILGHICVSILKALFYLKTEHGVIHRDVKPSNILLDRDGKVKLCDFGIAGQLINSNAKSRNAGVAAYIAPERIDPTRAGQNYDIRSDVWSLGIALVELACGEHPYASCKTDFELLVQVMEKDPPRLDPSKFSEEICDFVSLCLMKDVRRRPKYDKLLAHRFIKKYDIQEANEIVAEWFAAEQGSEHFHS